MSEHPDELKARLEALEAEAARLRQALEPQISESIAEDGEGQVEEKTATLDAEPPPPAPSQEQMDAADKVVQRYRLEKQRGNREIALKYLDEARTVAPNYSLVVECEGDELADAGKKKDAIEAYKRAFDLDSKNASAEKKHANLVFATQAAGMGLSLSIDETAASAKSATLLGLFLPGLGQLVTGQYSKGTVFVCLWIFAIAAIVLIPNGIREIGQIFGSKPSDGNQFNPLFFGAVFFGAIVWFSSLIDMQTQAKTLDRMNKRQKIQPPKPPVDLPFE